VQIYIFSPDSFPFQVVLDTEKLAYILIGTCCALSVICLVVVVVSMRCRKVCRLNRASSVNSDLLKGHGHMHHHHHHPPHTNLSAQHGGHQAKYVDWEDGVLESHVSNSTLNNPEATTHRQVQATLTSNPVPLARLVGPS
jgi:hypothetical protein